MNAWMKAAITLWCVLPAAVPAMQSTAKLNANASEAVHIRRTTDGIPHILSTNWRGLGYGFGYVQAQDALCTLADAFVTYEGRRAYFFGADQRPRLESTLGRPVNIDLDFFFRAFLNESLVTRYAQQQPREINELVVGFAAGYNRYLQDARHNRINASRRQCLHEPWVREVAPADVYRRMYVAGLAGGYSRVISELVNAQPPSSARRPAVGATIDLDRKLAHSVGAQPGVGSNMIAFGADATSDDRGVLFGNPHWYWGGPDRFYQAHLTIPGKLNVAGVSFLGAPVILIGFNENVAWTHTVSAASRIGVFELSLDSQTPTRYRVNDKMMDMEQMPITVEVRSDSGLTKVERILYRTRFGPLVDFGHWHPTYEWSNARAFSLRDINSTNYAAFKNILQANQAKSLPEFVEIQLATTALPWVNTAAIGRNDRRVWFGDVGAVPNVSDALWSKCAAASSQAWAVFNSALPALDGSRAECNWIEAATAALPGAMPAAQLPNLYSERYAANMNDSYWLSDPAHPMQGFARVFGGEREELSLRGRYGHHIAQSLLAGKQSLSAELSQRLRQEVLSARSYAADLFKRQLLDGVCVADKAAVTVDFMSKQSFDPPRVVDLKGACEILRKWPNTANGDDRGSMLWDAFWARLVTVPEEELFRVRFSPDAPLTTPSNPDSKNPKVLQALGAAVLELSEHGQALDAPRGQYAYASTGGRHIPLYGGCEGSGYFTVACTDFGQRHELDQNSLGNSYLQVVRFVPDGVEAFTMLAHGLDEDAVANGRGGEPVQRYARKEWLRMPFTEEEIAKDPALQVVVLQDDSQR